MNLDPNTAAFLMRAMNKRSMTLSSREIEDIFPLSHRLQIVQLLPADAIELRLLSTQQGQPPIEGEFKVLETAEC